jgi:hypothetical protein
VESIIAHYPRIHHQEISDSRDGSLLQGPQRAVDPLLRLKKAATGESLVNPEITF